MESPCKALESPPNAPDASRKIAFFQIDPDRKGKVPIDHELLSWGNPSPIERETRVCMAKAGQAWTARLPGGEEERKEKKEKKEKEKKEKEKKEKEKKEAGQDWTARLPEAGWRATRPCFQSDLLLELIYF